MSKECKVTIDAGVCKRITIITAKANPETGMVEIDIKSDCPDILKMSWSIKPICPYTEVEEEICKTDVYSLASGILPHAACPVPCGIIKAVEVAGDLGLKRDVSIKIE